MFDKALLTGVFAGIAGTVICLVYNIVYRSYSGFTPSEIINVSSLIFGINLLFLVIGLLYFIFLKAFKKGDILFIILFTLLTLFFLWQTAGIQRSPIHEVSVQFRGLLSGIIIISGICAAAGVPFLFHSKGFEKNVL